MSNPILLGLDVGGSATRWLFKNGVRSQSGENRGFSGHISQASVMQRASDALAEIAKQTGPVATIVAGVSGLSKNTPEALQLETLFGTHFGASKISLMSDIEIATRSAFPNSNGILVYAGTGSIAAYIDAEDRLHTAGGKGVLIDDAGGGYWIAVSAMRCVLRAEDTLPGSGWQSLLGVSLSKQLGGSDWPHVRTAFYGLDRGGVAMLALAVADAAKAGDNDAIKIFRSAGQELGNLAQKLMIRMDCREVTLSGRASMLHQSILDGMQQTLPAVTIQKKSLDSAQTALNLAQTLHDLAIQARSFHGND